MNRFAIVINAMMLGVLAGLAGTAQGQFGPDQASHAQGLDRIVAIVEDDIITQSELSAAVARARAQLAQRAPAPAPQALERQVLERLIVERLQQRAAERSGIVIDDATLNAAVASIAERNKMDLEHLRQAVEREGIAYPRFRDQVRRDLVLNRLRQREIDSRVQVSELEVDNALANLEADSREAAQELLFRRKVQEEWELWLRRLRDEAYVEIRL